MREIHVAELTDAIAAMAIKANISLGKDVCDRIHECKEQETWPVAKEILREIEENTSVAEREWVPLCQDTGFTCVFLEVGQDVHFVGGTVEEAIHEGVRQGYRQGYLRKSVVQDPIKRGNTKDNTPASIHYDIVPGDQVKIIIAPKGFGSENMSRISMLPPSAGEEGVKEFVVDTVKRAGANPCPPVIVGVGIGGTFDKVALLAKQALLLPLDQENQDSYYAKMERKLLEEINGLGIGPQGFGGKTTALAVKIKTFPTHIAGLPVAVNINCYISRHQERIL